MPNPSVPGPNEIRCAKCKWIGHVRFFTGRYCNECIEVRQHKQYLLNDREETLSKVRVGNRSEPSKKGSLVVRYRGKLITQAALERRRARERARRTQAERSSTRSR